MKKVIKDFILRGLVSCGFGPMVLAVLYLILRGHGVIDVLTVDQVSTGIFSLTVLAFVAGGMNVIYQIEQLPLMAAISIHGAVLYISYLITYLINDWLAMGTLPFLVFTGIFLFGYIVIWAVIYLVTRARTRRINALLKKNAVSAD